VSADVATGEGFFEVLEESRVNAHDIFEVAVLEAVFDHKDFAVALDDLSLDLADFFVEEDLVREDAVNDLLADFGDALGAKRVGSARPTERRASFLIRFEQGFIRPIRSERRVRFDAVKRLKQMPGGIGGEGEALLEVFNRLMHISSLLVSFAKLQSIPLTSPSSISDTHSFADGCTLLS